jgi:hypothetical protein
LTYGNSYGIIKIKIRKGDIKMKELQGTEKQVTWANQIRQENINTLQREIDELAARMLENSPSFKLIIDKLQKALNDLTNDTIHINAGWWIEHNNLAVAYIQRVKRDQK